MREYPADQQKFLDASLIELVKTEFLKVCLTASWQAAPHLASKDAKTRYCTTTDLRPVNAATTTEQWPMPIVEAELSAFEESSQFASLDFCSSYWRCPVDPQVFDACGIIAPQATYVSTRVLQKLKSASAYLQSPTSPWFEKTKQAIKA